MQVNVRDAFVAEEGHVLIAADYSQIELRVMAHFSRLSNAHSSYQRLVVAIKKNMGYVSFCVSRKTCIQSWY